MHTTQEQDFGHLRVARGAAVPAAEPPLDAACVGGRLELLAEGAEHDLEELVGGEEVVNGVLGDDGALEVRARLAESNLVGSDSRRGWSGPRAVGICARGGGGRGGGDGGKEFAAECLEEMMDDPGRRRQSFDHAFPDGCELALAAGGLDLVDFELDKVCDGADHLGYCGMAVEHLEDVGEVDLWAGLGV